MVAAARCAFFDRTLLFEDATGCHACSLEASKRVLSGIPLGCSLLSPVGTINSAQTLKERKERVQNSLLTRLLPLSQYVRPPLPLSLSPVPCSISSPGCARLICPYRLARCWCTHFYMFFSTFNGV
jgi:hypothetical protein